MDALKIAGVCTAAAVLCIIVKKKSPEIAVQISIAAGIIVFLFCVQYIKPITDFINETASGYSFAYESIRLLLKIIGIAYICEFTAQILRDADENSLADKVMLGAKLIIIVISLPILKAFLTMIAEISV